MQQGKALFAEFLRELGLSPGQHAIVHASLGRLRSPFPGLSAKGFIEELQHVGPSGSIVMPTFTYCFKRPHGPC